MSKEEIEKAVDGLTERDEEELDEILFFPADEAPGLDAELLDNYRGRLEGKLPFYIAYDADWTCFWVSTDAFSIERARAEYEASAPA